MKLRIVSDLHFEFMEDRGKSILAEIADDLVEDFEVLVVAGDIASYRHLYGALLATVKAVYPKPVVYVLGNHEAYGGTWPDALREARRAEADCYGRLTVLEQRVAVVQGRRFVGCTLWFPHSGVPGMLDKRLGDFLHIKGIYDWIAETAKQSARFLAKNIEPGDIVVTHHLPHPTSVHPMYEGSVLNQFFVHDVSPLVEEKQAALWIHGHTHSSCDYVVGKTRVVCNPFGYAIGTPMEPNRSYHSLCTVDC